MNTERNTTAHVADIVRVVRMLLAHWSRTDAPADFNWYGNAVVIVRNFPPDDTARLAVLNRVFGMDWQAAILIDSRSPLANKRAEQRYQRRHCRVQSALFDIACGPAYGFGERPTILENRRIDAHNARSLPGSV